MMVGMSLNIISSQSDGKLLSRLKKLEEQIKDSPTWRVYEACAGDLEGGPPKPPTRPHIRVLELIAGANVKRATDFEDTKYRSAKATYEKAIQSTEDSNSRHSHAKMRLRLSAWLLEWHHKGHDLRAEIIYHVYWVLTHDVTFEDLVPEAENLKKALDRKAEIAKVVAAMNVVSGYNYGGSWASH